MADTTTQNDHEISVENTIRLFEGGLTANLSLVGAIRVVEGWADKIDATGRSDLHGIAQLLRRLSTDLGTHPRDGKAIGDTMQRLGAHTAEAASTAAPELAEPLKKLAGLVKAAGIALAGGRRPDEIAGISTDASGTAGDPTLRSETLAPDRSGERVEPDDTGVEAPNRRVREDVNVTGSDLTKGEEPLNPH